MRSPVRHLHAVRLVGMQGRRCARCCCRSPSAADGAADHDALGLQPLQVRRRCSGGHAPQVWCAARRVCCMRHSVLLLLVCALTLQNALHKLFVGPAVEGQEAEGGQQ